MLTSKPSKNSIPNDIDLESDKGSVDSEATISETSTGTAQKSAPIDSEVPSTVDSLINNNICMSANSAINADID